jgi:uncharacterized protein with PIN domain
MVIHTSAPIALLRLEPEAGASAKAMEADPRHLVSAVTKLEARMLPSAGSGRLLRRTLMH